MIRLLGTLFWAFGLVVAVVSLLAVDQLRSIAFKWWGMA